jgi:ATP-dependent DNA helicase 2 subunit 2
MAEKEATVYVIDVGKSMGRRHNGRSISDLDWAMKYGWDKITTTVNIYLPIFGNFT